MPSMHSHTRDRHSHSLAALFTMSSSDRARDRTDESDGRTSSPSVAHQLAALIGLAHDESDSPPHPAVVRAAHGLHIDAELARRLRHNPAFGLQPGDIVHHDCREGRDAQADAIRGEQSGNHCLHRAANHGTPSRLERRATHAALCACVRDCVADASREVRMVQWNIERGYKLAQIIDKLKEQDADVRTDISAAHAWPAGGCAEQLTVGSCHSADARLALLIVLSVCVRFAARATGDCAAGG